MEEGRKHTPSWEEISKEIMKSEYELLSGIIETLMIHKADLLQSMGRHAGVTGEVKDYGPDNESVKSANDILRLYDDIMNDIDTKIKDSILTFSARVITQMKCSEILYNRNEIKPE